MHVRLISPHLYHTLTMQETRIPTPHSIYSSINYPRHHHLLEDRRQKRANLGQASAVKSNPCVSVVCAQQLQSVSHTGWTLVLKIIQASASLSIISILALTSSCLVSRLNLCLLSYSIPAHIRDTDSLAELHSRRLQYRPLSFHTPLLFFFFLTALPTQLPRFALTA